MKLYHGSTVRVERPDVSVGRDALDFGHGFYLTRDEEQAVRWTGMLGKREKSVDRVINIYEMDDSALVKYRYRMFDSYNEEWLDFIVSNRLGGVGWMDYDIVEGGIANDKVFDTIEIYMSGMIPKEVAIGRLRNERLRNQLCILNQSVADGFLSFVKSYIVE